MSIFILGKRGSDISQAMNSDSIILCLWVDFTTSPRDYVLTNEVVALHDCANIHVLSSRLKKKVHPVVDKRSWMSPIRAYQWPEGGRNNQTTHSTTYLRVTQDLANQIDGQDPPITSPVQKRA